MKWGTRSTECPAKLVNTCSINNFLWISFCYYKEHLEALTLLRQSNNGILSDFDMVMTYMLSENYDEGRIKFLSMSTSIQDSSIVNAYDSDARYCLLPFAEVFVRTCTAMCSVDESHGKNKRELTSTCLSFPSKHIGNVVEAAIKNWIDGGEQPYCSFIYGEKPDKKAVTRIQTYENVDAFCCGGKDVLNGVTFKIPGGPPYLIFDLDIPLAQAINDLSLMPVSIDVYGYIYRLAGCTVQGTFFRLYIFKQKQ